MYRDYSVLRILREKNKLTNRFVAKSLFISEILASSIETIKVKADPKIRKLFSEFYKMDEKELFDENGHAKIIIDYVDPIEFRILRLDKNYDLLSIVRILRSASLKLLRQDDEDCHEMIDRQTTRDAIDAAYKWIMDMERRKEWSKAEDPFWNILSKNH